MNYEFKNESNFSQPVKRAIKEFLMNSKPEITLHKPYLNYSENHKEYDFARSLETIPFSLKVSNTTVFCGLYNIIKRRFLICDTKQVHCSLLPNRANQLAEEIQYDERQWNRYVIKNWDWMPQSLEKNCKAFFGQISALPTTNKYLEEMELYNMCLNTLQIYLQDVKINTSANIWNKNYENKKNQNYYNNEYSNLSSLETDI